MTSQRRETREQLVLDDDLGSRPTDLISRGCALHASRPLLGCVLDRYKDGSIDKNDALDDIAYLVAAVDVPGGYNCSAFMLSVIEDLNG